MLIYFSYQRPIKRIMGSYLFFFAFSRFTESSSMHEKFQQEILRKEQLKQWRAQSDRKTQAPCLQALNQLHLQNGSKIFRTPLENPRPSRQTPTNQGFPFTNPTVHSYPDTNMSLQFSLYPPEPCIKYSSKEKYLNTVKTFYLFMVDTYHFSQLNIDLKVPCSTRAYTKLMQMKHHLRSSILFLVF